MLPRLGFKVLGLQVQRVGAKAGQRAVQGMASSCSSALAVRRKWGSQQGRGAGDVRVLTFAGLQQIQAGRRRLGRWSRSWCRWRRRRWGSTSSVLQLLAKSARFDTISQEFLSTTVLLSAVHNVLLSRKRETERMRSFTMRSFRLRAASFSAAFLAARAALFLLVCWCSEHQCTISVTLFVS